MPRIDGYMQMMKGLSATRLAIALNFHPEFYIRESHV